MNAPVETPVNEMTSRAEIMEEADRVLGQIAEIKQQVSSVKRECAANDTWADPVWLTRAETALRFKGRRHQLLLRRAKELKQAENAAKNQAWERSFVEAARRRLKPETFQALLDEAKPASEEAGG